MQDDLYRGAELAVQRRAIEAAQCGERFEPCGHLGKVVGVHRACATVVTGIERRKQVDDLTSTDLADNDSIGPHPQCLLDQFAHGHLADALDVGTAGDQLDQVRVPGSQLGGVLHTHDALVGRHGAQQGGQQRGLAGAGSARDDERQPRIENVAQQPCGLDRDRPRRGECVEVLGGRPEYPQRQAGARSRDRGQHRVQSHRGPTPGAGQTQIAEVPVNPGLGFVQAAARLHRQSLCKPSHGGLVSELNGASPQTIPVVHPDGVGSRHQHVGGARTAQQWFENSRAHEFGLQRPQTGQHLGIAQHAAGLRTDRRRYHARAQRCTVGREPFSDSIDQRRTHGANSRTRPGCGL